MKKIILVNASPRKDGNCSKAMEIIRENANDAEIEVFNLREKQVNPCLACNYCKSKDSAECVQKDDMAALLSKIDSCDALVVASPIYFGMVNGSAKTFLDRIYPFFNPAKPNMTCATKFGKKLGIVLTANTGSAEVYAKHGESYASFDVAGFMEKEILAFNCKKCGAGGDIFSDPMDAVKIKKLAEWLIS